MSELAEIEIPQDWLNETPWRWLTIEISVMGNRLRASICGRCGAVVFDMHKPLHEEFHARIVEDPRYPYTDHQPPPDGSMPPDLPTIGCS